MIQKHYRSELNRSPKVFNMTLKPNYPSGMPRGNMGLLEDRDDGKGWLLVIHVKVQMSKEEENAP
jgi:hypothetical protein